jgi:hypothetical protein
LAEAGNSGEQLLVGWIKVFNPIKYQQGPQLSKIHLG